jgi:hypothetical protein
MRGGGRILAALNLAVACLPWFWVSGAPLCFLLTTAGLKDGTGIVLFDERRKERGGFQVTKDGSTLVLLDENEKVRGRFSAMKDKPMLVLLDEKGKRLFFIPNK